MKWASKVGEKGHVEAWMIIDNVHPPTWVVAEMTTGTRQITRSRSGKLRCLRHETNHWRDCEPGSWIVKNKRGYIINMSQDQFSRLYTPA
jgi:hypothetical protein